MKKFLTILLAAMVATTAVACIASSAASMGPIGDDLLAESGLGDPQYLSDNSITIDGKTWLGHESWNTNEGWDGFCASTGNGDAPYATREIIDDEVDGEQVKVIRLANDTESSTGGEFGIENIDKICDMEDGTQYIAYATVKVVTAPTNGHEFILAWRKSCDHGNNTTSHTVIPTDGEYHTLSVIFTYSQDDIDARVAGDSSQTGEYLFIGCCENWINAGAELRIASVEVYEYGEVVNSGDSVIAIVAAFTVALAATVVFAKRSYAA